MEVCPNVSLIKLNCKAALIILAKIEVVKCNNAFWHFVGTGIRVFLLWGKEIGDQVVHRHLGCESYQCCGVPVEKEPWEKKGEPGKGRGKKGRFPVGSQCSCECSVYLWSVCLSMYIRHICVLCAHVPTRNTSSATLLVGPGDMVLQPHASWAVRSSMLYCLLTVIPSLQMLILSNDRAGLYPVKYIEDRICCSTALTLWKTSKHKQHLFR